MLDELGSGMSYSTAGHGFNVSELEIHVRYGVLKRKMCKTRLCGEMSENVTRSFQELNSEFPIGTVLLCLQIQCHSDILESIAAVIYENCYNSNLVQDSSKGYTHFTFSLLCILNTNEFLIHYSD